MRLLKRIPAVAAACASVGLGYVNFQEGGMGAAFPWFLMGAFLGFNIGQIAIDIVDELGKLWSQERSLILSVAFSVGSNVFALALIYCVFWFFGALFGIIPNRHFQPLEADWIRQYYGLPLLPPLLALAAIIGETAFDKQGFRTALFRSEWQEADYVKDRPNDVFWWTFGMVLLTLPLAVLLVVIAAPFALAYANWGLAEALDWYNPFGRPVSLGEVYWFWVDQTVKGALYDVAAVLDINLQRSLVIAARQHWLLAVLLIGWRWSASILLVGGGVWFVLRMAKLAYVRIKGR